MKVKKIVKEIEKHAPLTLAWEYDSAGLNVGSLNAEVSKVLLTENVTMEVLGEAIENNCGLIISHHPSIFGEGNDLFTKEIVEAATKNNIVLYSAHTNLDAAKDGINDKLCDLFKINANEGENCCYRIGAFETKETLKDKTDFIQKVLKDNNVRTVGDLNEIVSTCCVSCGAGARDDELVEILKDKNVDVLIGGESKLSIALKLKHYGISLIEISHYNSEIICLDIFEDWLKDLDVEILKSNKDINPYN